MKPRFAIPLFVFSLGYPDSRPIAAEGFPPLQVEQITFGPKHHYYGYIGHVGNIPWNRSGRYLVALRTDFQDRLPAPDEAAEIVLLDASREYRVTVLDRTLAWNPQQGTMLYWNPEAPETQFFFNDRDPETGKPFCVLYDLSAGDPGRRIKEYRFDDTPIGNSGVRWKGGSFLGVNYARLARLRPVTGYPEAYDWTVGVNRPEDDGVFLVDAASGEKRLLVSYRRMADALRPSRPDVDDRALFINHTLWNRDCDRIYFFARADFETKERIDAPFTIRPDGTGLTLHERHIGGHPEWAEGRLLVGRDGDNQILYDTDSQSIVGTLGDPSILPKPEGDIALSPDGDVLVNGFGAGGRNYYAFYRRSDGAHARSEGFDRNGWVKGPLRLDPAPCWNRTGDRIVFPAIANDPERTRQMFQLKFGAVGEERE